MVGKSFTDRIDRVVMRHTTRLFLRHISYQASVFINRYMFHASITTMKTPNEEERRRSVLYGSSSTKHFPRLQVLPSNDARCRSDLRALQLRETAARSSEMPPRPSGMDSIPGHAVHTTAWKLGYQNATWMENGFEPRDSAKEVVGVHANRIPMSTAIAYASFDSNTPLYSPSRTLESNGCPSVKSKRKAWNPGGARLDLPTMLLEAENPRDKPEQRSTLYNTIEQEFPIRKADAPLVTSPECPADDCQTKRTHVNLAYKAQHTIRQVQSHLDKHKVSVARYKLPVESPSYTRAYRLGLSSSKSTVAFEKKVLRPKSTAGTFGKLRPVSANPLRNTSETSHQVAGAKRRPHTASVCYLKESTICCVEPSADGGNFDSVLAKEREKRKEEKEAVMNRLAVSGLFYNLPLKQIFARLRREAAKNLGPASKFYRKMEMMSLEDYLMNCGSTLRLSHVSDTSESNLASPMLIPRNARRRMYTPEQMKTDEDQPNDTNSSEPIVGMKKMLAVSRQQFQLAMEAFALSTSEVNAFFSVLDLDVRDQVEVWDVLENVAQLQEDHKELRRSRVPLQVQERGPAPKESINVLRRSVTVARKIYDDN